MTESVWSNKHKMRTGYNGSGEPILYCRECRGTRPFLTTHCVVRMLTDKEEAEIAAGKLDFAYGEWVKK